MNSCIFIGDNKTSFEESEVKIEVVKINDENYYKITNVDTMRPFFMSIVSYSNHWMFLSSNGGITAGRKNSDSALFPYYTDDKIIESSEITGSKTLLKIHSSDKIYLWEPFSNRYKGLYNIKRNLYKNTYGNKVIFEEINHDLQLTFRYHWNSSEKYGFVKKSELLNDSNSSIKVEVLDGLQNILPYGVETNLQLGTSNLVDAYKRNELATNTSLGIFALSAIIVDKAEPSEALKATTVWSAGISNPIYLLSSLQLDNFRKGQKIEQETDIKAERGAYFVHSSINLESKSTKNWILVAEVNQSLVEIHQIEEQLKNEKDLIQSVQNDIDTGTQKLVELIGRADGIQLTEDALVNTRHFANTLFNCMRGGIFDNHYNIEKKDFIKYLTNANLQIANKKKQLLEKLPKVFSLDILKEIVNKEQNNSFKRLCLEYLPLTFSRRHGDPSRPWNKFSINTKSEIDGSKILDYEGNWRDIFQNWEALVHSYPEYIEAMIHKFLNATTFDGYNPYRVTKGGFDWETVEPDNPWSYIGYWGDHQIIYLLKFLEFSEKYYPKKLEQYFDKNIFVYANVPYKIKEYNDILKNPKDTIVFDVNEDKKIRKRREKTGADGTLLTQGGEIYNVNLMEKLLATVLAKISNFIPEGGIWMNTQRPEWNDANNALVGNGVSMVTLYYLYRFLNFFKVVLKDIQVKNYEISEELSAFFFRVVTTFENNKLLLSGTISDEQRKVILDGLGQAGSDFRTKIYKDGFSGKKTTLSKDDLLQFTEISLQYLKHTIQKNKRKDGLYHSYNLMTIKDNNKISISYLSEMLEGQVAILSSGYLSSEASVQLLDTLKKSTLFREDQYSYILYPNKELPLFIAKNHIPSQRIKKSLLAQQLLEDEDKNIIVKDIMGNYHFNGNFQNANDLKKTLGELPPKYNNLVVKEADLWLEIFEEVFNHKAFTGRSGTFFGYEGLGSIYWHMVSKLALAVQEITIKSFKNNENITLSKRLLEHYYEIYEGLGVHKSPKLYGAFPTDPYSHTPANKGVQQPGMTGQVKEDILSRLGELGISVKNGKLFFAPYLLRKKEFLRQPTIFQYWNIKGEQKKIKINENSLCFTYCQIPIIYKLGDKKGVKIQYINGNLKEFQDLCLDYSTSAEIFARTGKIETINVFIDR